jgi:hypothetical protein
MVEDLLKFSGGFLSAMRGEIAFPTHINRIKRPRRTQFLRRSSPKHFDGLRGINPAQRQLGAKGGKVIGLNNRMFWKPVV